MKLICGLGNPGKQYQKTRHNVGFLAIDRLVSKWNAIGPRFQFNGEVYQANQDAEKYILLKPQTYMNLSGRSVGETLRFLKTLPQDLIVIHDDVDLEPLTMKIKYGGGNGGHNGLKSIDENLGTSEYIRIRLGVGRRPGMETADYVLSSFSKEEHKRLDELLEWVADACSLIGQGKLLQAMNLYNRKGV